jgi:hypothetical protein
MGKSNTRSWTLWKLLCVCADIRAFQHVRLFGCCIENLTIPMLHGAVRLVLVRRGAGSNLMDAPAHTPTGLRRLRQA